jgi:hypothetical protein
VAIGKIIPTFTITTDKTQLNYVYTFQH